MLPSLLHMGFDNHYNCVDEHDYNQRMQILLPFDRVFPPVVNSYKFVHSFFKVLK